MKRHVRLKIDTLLEIEKRRFQVFCKRFSKKGVPFRRTAIGGVPDVFTKLQFVIERFRAEMMERPLR